MVLEKNSMTELEANQIVEELIEAGEKKSKFFSVLGSC